MSYPPNPFDIIDGLVKQLVRFAIVLVIVILIMEFWDGTRIWIIQIQAASIALASLGWIRVVTVRIPPDMPHWKAVATMMMFFIINMVSSAFLIWANIRLYLAYQQ